MEVFSALFLLVDKRNEVVASCHMLYLTGEAYLVYALRIMIFN